MIKKKDIVKALERDAALRISANNYDEVPSNEVQKIHALFQKSPQHRKSHLRPIHVARFSTVACLLLLFINVLMFTVPAIGSYILDFQVSQQGDYKIFRTHNGVVYETDLVPPSYLPAEWSSYSLETPPGGQAQFTAINEAGEKLLLTKMADPDGIKNYGDQEKNIKEDGFEGILSNEYGLLSMLWIYDGHLSFCQTRVNVLPVPTTLSSLTSAPRYAAPCLTIASPRPVPPISREWLLSDR